MAAAIDLRQGEETKSVELARMLSPLHRLDDGTANADALEDGLGQGNNEAYGTWAIRVVRSLSMGRSRVFLKV